MVKRQLNQKEIEVKTAEGVDKRIEQTLTYDDALLPTPTELADYKKVDPRLVDHLMELAKAEQNYRHQASLQKLSIFRRFESRSERMNFWGMTYAFMSLVVFACLTAYALYLNSPWFAGFFAVTSIVTIISIFVKAGRREPES